MNRRVPRSATRPIRRLVQFGMVALVSYLALRHQYGSGGAPLDSLCPFGAIEALPILLAEGGFIRRIGPSNLVLIGSVALVTLAFGGVFCGWLCPFGAVQDWLASAGRRLFGGQFAVPTSVHKYLRHLRWGVLALIVWMSYRTMGLWFADYDPFRAMFHMKFESGLAIVLIAATVIGALLVERFWCTYACPLGALTGVLGMLGIVRVSRDAESCTECGLCTAACPSRVEVAVAPNDVRDQHCTMCTECVDACPVPEALRLNTGSPTESLRPVWIGVVGVVLFFALIGTASSMGWWIPGAGCGGCAVAPGEVVTEVAAAATVSDGSRSKASTIVPSSVE